MRPTKGRAPGRESAPHEGTRQGGRPPASPIYLISRAQHSPNLEGCSLLGQPNGAIGAIPSCNEAWAFPTLSLQATTPPPAEMGGARSLSLPLPHVRVEPRERWLGKGREFQGAMGAVARDCDSWSQWGKSEAAGEDARENLSLANATSFPSRINTIWKMPDDAFVSTASHKLLGTQRRC